MTIELAVEISPGDESNERLADRVDRMRRELAGGGDDWSRRFERVEASVELGFWEKREGLLTHFERAAELERPEDLARFFSDTGLHVSYAVADGVAELAIYPSAPARATRRQRRRVERTLESWVTAVGDYLRSAAGLYAYLDTRPDRAAAAFGDLFGDLVADAAAEELEPLEEHERRLVGDVEEAMEEVWGILRVESGEEYSLNELSKLVYDPFPCRLTVRPAARAREVEGFAGAELLVAGGTGLWEALEALEGRWLSPDPLLLVVRHSRSQKPIDVFEVAKLARRADPAAAGELRAAVEEALAPAPLYRAVWQAPAG